MSGTLLAAILLAAYFINGSRVDGGYSPWSDWSACSQTCGGGRQSRQRTCTNPSPIGCDYLRPSMEHRDCNSVACLTNSSDVNGGWSKWSTWTACHVTCGGNIQTQKRHRTCTNPPPQGKGLKCQGDAEQSHACKERPCPPSCVKALDLGIVLDASNSISQQNFNKALNFLSSIATHLLVSTTGIHVGLVTSSIVPAVEFSLGDSRYHSMMALRKKIGSLTYHGGSMRIDKALKMAGGQLFTYRGGDRYRVPNILLVITAGRMGTLGVPYEELLRPLQVKGVRTMAVGIGHGTDSYELLQIAMGDSHYVVQVSDANELKNALQNVLNKLCQARPPPPATPECTRIDALGLASGGIHSAAVTASSQLDKNHGPELARLHLSPVSGRAGGWCAKHRDPEQWLQVDFSKPVMVAKLATQGRYDRTVFVKSYWVSYSQGAGYFVPYKVDGKVKIFRGNADRDTVVTHSLARPIYARYVRINPVTWSGSVCMRAELYGCRTGFVPPPRMPCMESLGLEHNRIADSHITASSELNRATRPANARLYWHSHGGRAGGWTAAGGDRIPWLQVHLGPETKIRAIAMQGRQDAAEWVTEYSVSHSEDGVFWQDYGAQGRTKIFAGNSDQHGVVTQLLDPPIIARHVRIHPQSSHGHTSLRIELYGCTSGFVVPRPECTRELGMTNGGIPNAHVTATSHLGPRTQPFFARVNMPIGAWTAKTNDRGQWLQLDIGRVAKVTRVATQGSYSADEWVTSYRLASSLDNGYYQAYADGKILAGNKDRNSLIGHILHPSILARYIRVLPMTWRGRISLRVEIYGCTTGFAPPIPPRCMTSLGLEHGSLRNDQLTASSQLNSNTDPDRARLHLQPEGGKGGGWTAGQSDPRQWLQVDFQQTVQVTRITTQGRHDAEDWVESYQLQYSQDGYLYESYKHNHKPKVFISNKDRYAVVSHVISPPIVARYIRVVPVSWHGRIALRLDLYGCTSGFPRPPKPQCAKPVGLENFRIRDNALSASSSLDNNHGPQRARLNSAGNGILAGSWTARVNDQKQWIQVDLGAYMRITRVATQGRADKEEWVTRYHVQYSGDGKAWKTYKDNSRDKEFTGNSGRNTVHVSALDPPINSARYIRVLPTRWHGRISLRMELFGCRGVGPTHAPCDATLDVGILMDRSSSLGYHGYRKARDFMTSLVTRLNIAPSGTRLGIVAYSGYPQKIVDFRYTHVQTPSTMRNVISGIPYTAGWTRTDLALRFANDNLFSDRGGDRPGSNDVLIVITDGSSHGNMIPYHVVLKPLLDKGVKVIAVGVGSRVQSKELLKIANNQYNSVISITDINNLLILLNTLARDACPVPTQPPSCTAGWLPFKSNCYFFEHQYRAVGKWHDASLSCKTMGGHLIDIHGNEEWDWVRSHLKQGPGVGGAPREYLIGMRDKEVEHHWKWEDGSYVRLFRWATGSPSGGRDKNCAAMHAGNGLYTDVSCDQQIGYFACKRSME